MEDFILKIEKLHKSFGEKVILNDLNINITRNTSQVIIGGSGTGKSVLIKCILGLIQQDGGIISFDNTPLNRDTRKKINFYDKIGMLFQGAALFDSLTVWENITFAIKSKSKSDLKEIAIDKIHKVGLDSSVINLYPSELSGGMQKRVALARAIAKDPQLIFFDEPTTGLDPIMADVINNLINEVIDKIGATAITITHDMESAKKIADKISMLYKGNIIWSGNPGEIERSDNPYVDQFIHGRSEGPIKINIKD